MSILTVGVRRAHGGTDIDGSESKEREVGNRPVVEIIRVQTRLLENGNDGGDFEAGGN